MPDSSHLAVFSNTSVPILQFTEPFHNTGSQIISLEPFPFLQIWGLRSFCHWLPLRTHSPGRGVPCTNSSLSLATLCVCVCLYEMMAPWGPHPQRSLDLSPNHSIYLTYLFMVCLCDDAGFQLSSNFSWWKVQCYWLSISVGEFAQCTMFLEDNACFFFIPCMF